MNVALAVIIAIVAVALLGTWYYALWRGWRHASRDQTPVERRIVVSGVAALALLPVALALAGASDGAAMIAIAVAMAVVLPALIIVGARDHRRREGRIRERHHGTSDGDI
jgi:O-antigen/teichoic acid export membrane protein